MPLADNSRLAYSMACQACVRRIQHGRSKQHPPPPLPRRVAMHRTSGRSLCYTNLPPVFRCHATLGIGAVDVAGGDERDHPGVDLASRGGLVSGSSRPLGAVDRARPAVRAAPLLRAADRGGIGTDVLAARLRTLQGQGFVRKVIPPRVPLTSMLAGATAIPRQADGRYEVRLGDEAIRVDVIGGQVHAAQTASRTPPSS